RFVSVDVPGLRRDDRLVRFQCCRDDDQVSLCATGYEMDVGFVSRYQLSNCSPGLDGIVIMAIADLLDACGLFQCTQDIGMAAFAVVISEKVDKCTHLRCYMGNYNIFPLSHGGKNPRRSVLRLDISIRDGLVE